MKTEKEIRKRIEELKRRIPRKFQPETEAAFKPDVEDGSISPIEIDREDYDELIRAAKLEGYKLAKEEFNKKVEELKKKIETQIMFCSNSEEAHKIEGLQEAIKILDEALK